jgi:creatinine amidohydrolase/Fe(II)-dependent formamide hydrolase-like protein
MADHAGFYETSLIMAAHPALVDQARLTADAPWYTHTASSKASEASAEAGQRMWNAMVNAWVNQINLLQTRRNA